MSTQTWQSDSAPGELEDFALHVKHERKPNLPVVIPARVVTAQNLSELDIEAELLAQYKTGQSMLNEIINSDAPANQKAQVFNSVTSTIAQITASQTKLYDAERVKKLEQALIKTLQGFPEMHAAFMTLYKMALNNA